ncbi:LOW QUALITY PROTEIN: protein NipSnap homolog 3A [Erpetoichthys calabaricus]|uniref:LOW QUALITY PROTEIN: protein NipSnap homolog 3A n=1 Tax=Erpetoichthys calabaricus TaxID=27687 RepID=UPI0022343AB1|nr:LOW QUALITY PROTEIN: protein NipSnap homolog 3A [Erpetoichthys calabaricus]
MSSVAKVVRSARGLLLRGSFRQAATQLRADISTGPQQQHGNFLKFRTYDIKPDHLSAFLKLTDDNIQLRTAHSELVGYWTVEHGGLNQVFHIWKYDSYAQRTAVRAALAKDHDWMSKYISKMMPMLNSQDSEVNYLVPWCKLGKPPKQGVYELVSFQMKPGGPAVWGPAFQAAINTHDSPGYAQLIGVFHSEFGDLNKGKVRVYLQTLYFVTRPTAHGGSH